MGKTMGIVGMGAIGKLVAKAARDLGMRVVCFDRKGESEIRDVEAVVDIDAVFSASDYLSLHIPCNDYTRNIINSESIGKMKDGVILVNNARGQLVAEQDLADALNSGKVYAAGIDVVSREPISADNPLLKAKNCLITPHISWAPRESRQRIMDTTAENVKAFLAGSPVNVVNQ